MGNTILDYPKKVIKMNTYLKFGANLINVERLYSSKKFIFLKFLTNA